MEEKKGMSLGVKVAISYVICFGLAIASFFGLTMLNIVMGMNNSNSILDLILSLLQFIVPMLLLLFGWAPPIVFRKKKRQD